MKQTLTILAAVAIGFLLAVLLLKRQQPTPVVETAAPAAVAPAAHLVEEAVPERSRGRPAVASQETEKPLPEVPRRTLQDLLNELASIQVTPGPGQARAQYRILALLDQLAQSGSTAVPAIHEFLKSNKDVAYNVSTGGRNGNGMRSAALPPSLRMGLFDVVRQVGGVESEQVLAETLTATGSAAELVYLNQLLDESSPGKYRDATLSAVRALLAGGKITDAGERGQLYDLLLQLKDTSYVQVAQANLVKPDGTLDVGALRYLQQAMGEKSLALAAQMLQDKRVADTDSREALGRLALNYVGANEAALPLFHQTALDPQIKPDQRRNLIEDLNQDGLVNRKNPSPEDLKIIANRYALTQTYLQQDYVVNDKMLNAAFQEANKDLAKMLERAAAQKPPK